VVQVKVLEVETPRAGPARKADNNRAAAPGGDAVRGGSGDRREASATRSDGRRHEALSKSWGRNLCLRNMRHALSDSIQKRDSETMFSAHIQSARRYLVFTSAGDRANLHKWLGPTRSFDLWVTYYGDDGERYRDVADIYTARKGGKFQNLLHAYHTYPDIIKRYDAVMVMDDDVIIRGDKIDKLFRLREELGIWILQPAFSPLGRISFPITRVNRTCRLRYTSFVEMTCPLFQRNKLDDFMKVYDPLLVGFGCDWWFIDSLGDDIAGKVAVVDEVTCINPMIFFKKGKGREIDRLQSLQKQMQIWSEVAAKYEIRSMRRGQVEYSSIRKTGLAFLAGHVASLLEYAFLVVPMRFYVQLKSLLGKAR
jgi:hypothetical protein